MKNYIILGLMLVFTWGLSAQEGEDTETPSNTTPRTITLKRVTDSLYVLQGKGGNIGVSFGEDGVLLIDSQFAEVTPEIINVVKGFSDKPIKFLVNTHHHGDHTGGNENMNDNGTVIMAHENVTKRLRQMVMKKAEKEQEAAFERRMANAGEGDNRAKAEIDAKKQTEDLTKFMIQGNIYPMITFSENMTISYNGEPVMLIHVHNAHTDGDTFVYFTQSNVIHTGDLFFNSRYPYIDLDHGGDYDGYIQGLNQMLALMDDNTKVIPGHGAVGTKADVEALHDMMLAVRDRTAFHYVSGKTREEVVAMKDLTKEYDEQGYGDYYIKSERFVGMAWDMAKKKYGKIETKKR